MIELDGRPVARLLPGLQSLRDRLTEAFDYLDEDALYISQLENRVAQLERLRGVVRPAPGPRP